MVPGLPQVQVCFSHPGNGAGSPSPATHFRGRSPRRAAAASRLRRAGRTYGPQALGVRWRNRREPRGAAAPRRRSRLAGQLPLSPRWRPGCVGKSQTPGKPGTVCSRPAASIFCQPDTSGWCTHMRPRADLSNPAGSRPPCVTQIGHDKTPFGHAARRGQGCDLGLRHRRKGRIRIHRQAFSRRAVGGPERWSAARARHRLDRQDGWQSCRLHPRRRARRCRAIRRLRPDRQEPRREPLSPRSDSRQAPRHRIHLGDQPVVRSEQERQDGRRDRHQG